MTPIAGWVAHEHPATGFSAIGPEGFELKYGDEARVYEIAGGDPHRSFWYGRAGGPQPPIDALHGWAERMKAHVDRQYITAAWARVDTTAPDGGGWIMQAQRDEAGLLELSSYGPLEPDRTTEKLLDDERTLAMLFSSARGGTVISIPAPRGPEATAEPAAAAAAQPAEPIPLKDYSAEDKTVAGKYPDAPGWVVSGGGGMLCASHPQHGELWMGLSRTVAHPGGWTSMAAQHGIQLPNQLTLPLLGAEQALMQVWLPWRNELAQQELFADLQVERSEHLTSAAWGSGGVFTVRVARAGAPWRGVVAVTTSQSPLDQDWRCYCSSMLVPQDGDPLVWTALRSAWDAFRPAARGPTQAELELRAIRQKSDGAWFAGLSEMNLKQRQLYGFAPKPPPA